MPRPTWLKPTKRPRTCDGCGGSYHRRNLVEAWDAQNPGSRVGWHKTRLRLCTKCSGGAQAQRILNVASILKAPGKESKQA
jgi:hypothetical protein